MQASTHKQAHTDQYTILIAFPQQQWFRENASYVHCLYCYVLCRLVMAYRKVRST
jgi:hypothetical protein